MEWMSWSDMFDSQALDTKTYDYIIYLHNKDSNQPLGVIFKLVNEDLIHYYKYRGVGVSSIKEKYGIDTAKTLLMLEVTSVLC